MLLHRFFLFIIIFQLVYQAIDSVVKSYNLESADGNLLKAIVSVHVAYDSVKAHIQQFQNLSSLEPGIVDVLIDTVPYPAAEMVSQHLFV